MNDKNENTNCLAGMRCYKCGSFGPFKIEIKHIVLVYDDGTEDNGSDTEWDDDSYCECDDCSEYGTVKDFQVKNQKKN